MKGFLRQKDVQELLGVSRQTLWKWRQEDIGPPAVKVGGVVLYPEDGFEDWKAEREAEGDQKPND